MSRFIGFGEPGISEERKVLTELVRRKQKLRDKVDQNAGQLVELRSEVAELFAPITTSINKQVSGLVGKDVKEDPTKLRDKRENSVVLLEFVKSLEDEGAKLGQLQNPTQAQADRLAFIGQLPLQQEAEFHKASLEYIDKRLEYLSDPSDQLKMSRAMRAESDLLDANTKMVDEYKKLGWKPLEIGDVKKKSDELLAEQKAAEEQARLVALAARKDVLKVWGEEFVVPDLKTSKPFLDVLNRALTRGSWDNKGTPPREMTTGPGGMYPTKQANRLIITWVPYNGNGRAECVYYPDGAVAEFNYSGADRKHPNSEIPLDTKVLLMGLIGFGNPPQDSELDFTDEDVRDYIYAYTQTFGSWQPQTDGFDRASDLMTAITSGARYADIVKEVQDAYDPAQALAALPGQALYDWGTSEFLPRGTSKSVPITAGLGMKKHPKGKPYRVGPDGQFGDLSIDIPALYNKALIVATTQDGKKVMDERATLGLVNLLTKRVHAAMKHTYTPQAKAQFAKLVSLSGLEPPVKSKKYKMVQKVQTKKAKGKGHCSDDDSPDVVVCGDMNDVVKRLHAATGMFEAGNRSKKNCMLITELATKLAEESLITPTQYRRILANYVPKSK